LQKGESLDELNARGVLPACGKSSGRVDGMRIKDVQFVGAVTLHEGRIAAMKTVRVNPDVHMSRRLILNALVW